MLREFRCVFETFRIVYTTSFGRRSLPLTFATSARSAGYFIWNARQFTSDAAARSVIQAIREKEGKATPEELIHGMGRFPVTSSLAQCGDAGLEVLQEDPKPSLVFYTDLEYLGSGIHDRAAEFGSPQIVQVLRCYARLKYVRPKQIEHLAWRVLPTELTLPGHFLFLAALGTLQRLHDKSQGPKHSLFAMERLPCFGMLKHTPLFPSQVHMLDRFLEAMDLSGENLDSRNVSTVVYVLSQLAPLETSSAKLAHSLSLSAMRRDILDTVACSILLYSLSRFNVLDASLIRFLLAKMFNGASLKRAIPVDTISMALYSMARLRFCDRRIIVRLLHDAQRAEALRSFSAWDLSSVLYSLAQLRFKGKDDALAGLCQEIVRSRRLSTFSEQGLALVVYAMGHIQLQNTTFLGKVLDEALLPSRMEQLTYQGLCMMVHGLSRMSQTCLQALHEPHQVLLQLLTDTVAMRSEHVKKLPPQEVVSLLFGTMLCRTTMDPAARDDFLATVHETTGGFDASFLQPLSANELRIMMMSLQKLNYKETEGWHSILMCIERRIAAESLRPSFALHILADDEEISYSTIPGSSERLEKLVGDAMDAEALRAATEEDLVRLVGASNYLREKRSAGLSLLFSEICRPQRLQHFIGHQFVLLISFLLSSDVEIEKKETVLKMLMKNVPLASVDASGLITLLYRISKHQPSDKWSMTLLQEMGSRSGFYASLKGSHLSMMAEALVHLEISDRQILFPLLQGLTSSKVLQDMSDKSLILLLQSSQKLVKGTSIHMAASLVRELRRRPSIAELPPDLMSMLLYSLGRCDIYDEVLFERALSSLESTSLLSFNALAVVNILDALGRFGQTSHKWVEPLVHHICASEKTLTIRELHHFLHFIGRAKIQLPTVQQFLQRVVQSDQMNAMDGPAMSGLVFAAATAGVTDAAFSDRLLEKALSPVLLKSCREGHLCNIVYRLHLFHPTALTEPLIVAFLEQMEQKLKAGEISVTKLGQWIMGCGKLAEKYSQPSCCMRLLSWMSEDHVLDRMPVGDIVGHLVAASQCSGPTLELAEKTAAYILRRGLLHSCTEKELSVLQTALSHYGDHLMALQRALSSILSSTGDIARH